MNEDDVIRKLRTECQRAGSIRAWADKAHITDVYVGDVLNGKRKPGKMILDALGLEKVVVYRKVKDE